MVELLKQWAFPDSKVHGANMGQHGAHLGPVGPRWAPCWPHEPCYQGYNLLFPCDILITFHCHYESQFPRKWQLGTHDETVGMMTFSLCYSDECNNWVFLSCGFPNKWCSSILGNLLGGKSIPVYLGGPVYKISMDMIHGCPYSGLLTV